MTLMPFFSPAALARERMAEAVMPLRPMMRVALGGFGNAQLRLFRMLDKLKGNQLQVLADLFYGRVHGREKVVTMFTLL